MACVTGPLACLCSVSPQAFGPLLYHPGEQCRHLPLHSLCFRSGGLRERREQCCHFGDVLTCFVEQRGRGIVVDDTLGHVTGYCSRSPSGCPPLEFALLHPRPQAGGEFLRAPISGLAAILEQRQAGHQAARSPLRRLLERPPRGLIGQPLLVPEPAPIAPCGTRRSDMSSPHRFPS